MKGKIIALQCGVYTVLSNEGLTFNIPARGAFRNKNFKPVVGDNVELNDTHEIIEKVEERTSYLKRPTVANLDQMIIVHSLCEPEFSYHLLFKYLTYANQNGIKAKIVLTKLDRADKTLVEQIKNTFETLGIEIYFVSNKKMTGIEEVKKLFANHTSCLLGQSGVGKSSLINAISPEFNRQVGEYSKALGRGKHKTKEVILLPYENGLIADTPGFSSLELDLFKEDLAQYFPGFNERFTDCYFSNCLHISENRCAVKQAIEEGKIPQIAYETYLKLSSEAIFKSERYSKWDYKLFLHQY